MSTYIAGSTECHFLDQGRKIAKCINCVANHLLDNYLSFLEKSLKEQISFLAKKKFCYACLQQMKKGHNSKTCDQRLSCSLIAVIFLKIGLKQIAVLGKIETKKLTIIMLM